MRLNFRHSLYLLAAMFLGACSGKGDYDSLRTSLNDFVDGKDASIGIAVIIDSKDTVEVNGHRPFPMLSVYKFPIAMALGEHYRQNKLPVDYPVAIMKEDLHPDTYSPMTEKLLASDSLIMEPLMMPTDQLLGYMLQQSDNNASDIVLKGLNGARHVDRYLKRLGITGIKVRNSEQEMHADTSLCRDNSSTPVAMAALMDRFDRDFNDPFSLRMKNLMETCATGTGRLPAPLASTDAVIGHKTGTGFTLPNGRLMAINDAGYVHLPDGHCYSIAVFIENSSYDLAATETLVAEISELVYKAVAAKH